ncbi:hypothetical protein PtA15_3A492 [Puccinia triticina]|uniref:Uncharacterized protein n=1 Tax=Puccinia triticina TaxID=208348 RepID=A0ABY7CDE3_9BASI|nr:uncharacterized protein PtA15_3A492 [Puccinia triticina]WAQ83125.1 hypothetical protein PtA15_3A492 [Puccinia triticina]
MDHDNILARYMPIIMSRMAANEAEDAEMEGRARGRRRASSRARREAPLRTGPVISFFDRCNAPWPEDPQPESEEPQPELEDPQPSSFVLPNAPPPRQTRPAVSHVLQWNVPRISDSQQRCGNRKPKLKKLPYVDREAKTSTLEELCSKGSPFAFPGGPRHPRVHTLIGRDDRVPPPRRGTPSSPTGSSEWQSTRRSPLQLLPDPPPPPSSQIGPVRQERRHNRSDPYAGRRRNRVRESSTGGN